MRLHAPVFVSSWRDDCAPLIHNGDLSGVLLLVICLTGLGERDRGTAPGPLTKEQVQQWSKNDKRRKQPDDCQPDELTRKRMVILKDHDCFDYMADYRYEDDYQEQECIC
jgi:hypothetical protein